MQTARRRYSAPDPGAGLTPGGGKAVAKLISFVLNLARLTPIGGGETIRWLANRLYVYLFNAYR